MSTILKMKTSPVISPENLDGATRDARVPKILYHIIMFSIFTPRTAATYIIIISLDRREERLRYYYYYY